MMLRKLLFLLLISTLVPLSSHAATLNVVGGQLMGASGVIVDGSSYDVQFLDGTCIALFNGCDGVSDFTFQFEVAAVLASQALLDQVFLDGPMGLFDSDEGLTNGCAGERCLILSPYGWDEFLQLGSGVAENFDGFLGDRTTTSAGSENVDTSLDPRFVYAVWSGPPVTAPPAPPIPEPGTAVLMGLGLLGLSARKRRDG